MVEIDMTSESPQNETKKQRIERYYQELANKAGFSSIEEFYTKTKFALVLMDEFWRSEEVKLKLLESIADDMWYSKTNKEFVIGSNVGKNNSNILNR